MKMTQKKVTPARRGFSLIEVMIVLAIIIMIVTLVAFNMRGARDDAKISSARINMRTLEKALERFYEKMGRYPTDDEGIRALWDKSVITDESEVTKWERLINNAEDAANDPWGTAWGYRQKDESTEENVFELWSFGPDKQDGTEDDIPLRKKTDEMGDGGVPTP